jgi:hypothetical protein
MYSSNDRRALRPLRLSPSLPDLVIWQFPLPFFPPSLAKGLEPHYQRCKPLTHACTLPAYLQGSWQHMIPSRFTRRLPLVV